MKKNSFRLRAGLLFALSLLFIQMSGDVNAQTVFLNHSQYGNFAGAVNPSLSLLTPKGSLSFVGRQQWVGMEGAPSAYLGNGYIGFERLGATAGIQIRQDKIGVDSHSEVSLSFSKSIRIAEHDYIGMSMSAGLVHFSSQFSSLDPMDPNFRDDIRESDALIGIGAVIYRPEVYYVGVSLPRLTNGGVGAFGDTRYNFENQYFLTAGYLWGFGESMHLRPSILMAYANSTGVEFNASAMVFAKQIFGLGVGMRNQGDLSGLLRLNFSGLGIGYSYQVNTRNQPLNRQINNSTHEVGLSYVFGGKQSML